jgi:hypothetical protein
MKNKIKNFLLANRLEKITTGNTVVDLAINLATELGGYVGGSRRFGLNGPESDVDVFFLTREGWESFSKFLGAFGTQETYTTPVIGSKSVPDGYKKLKTVYFETGKELHYIKGRYTLRGVSFDVSLVESFLSPLEEAEIYLNKIFEHKLK